ncbi:hypothetical protein KY290_037387 [Solanum tuberosum]|uniref:Uncharacterized protein n=1 Tax=Solanum tuberosum TaxID=4113 RepID=A0ABQ7TVE0_SOLTU|nr:hypothetical protein KY290_037387 [Solanum tuberosum]
MATDFAWVSCKIPAGSISYRFWNILLSYLPTNLNAYLSWCPGNSNCKCVKLYSFLNKNL